DLDPHSPRDHVHHRLVWLLHAAEEADAARGDLLRRGQHRARRPGRGDGHEGQRRQPDRAD
ncbi:MAG: Mycoredoxin, partial [uncultured Pseudonocardia sp.]